MMRERRLLLNPQRSCVKGGFSWILNQIQDRSSQFERRFPLGLLDPFQHQGDREVRFTNAVQCCIRLDRFLLTSLPDSGSITHHSFLKGLLSPSIRLGRGFDHKAHTTNMFITIFPMLEVSMEGRTIYQMNLDNCLIRVFPMFVSFL